MDDTTKLLLKLNEENIRFKVAYAILKARMEKARKEDAHFLLDEDDITEVLEIAGLLEFNFTE